MANIYIATSYNLNDGQLLGLQLDGQAVVIQIVQKITKEEHRKHNPQHTDEDYADLPEGTQFYETRPFDGEVVLAMTTEKKPNDIVRNERLGTWRILRSATSEEYLKSLQDFGETGPGTTLETIRTLLQAGQGDAYLYWAAPYLVPTALMHLTKDELIFLTRVLHDWVHEVTNTPAEQPTFVIAKIKEALGKLVGSETIQKLNQLPEEILAKVPVSVDRVH